MYRLAEQFLVDTFNLRFQFFYGCIVVLPYGRSFAIIFYPVNRDPVLKTHQRSKASSGAAILKIWSSINLISFNEVLICQ